jgi:hypothetical protein
MQQIPTIPFQDSKVNDHDHSRNLKGRSNQTSGNRLHGINISHIESS